MIEPGLAAFSSMPAPDKGPRLGDVPPPVSMADDLAVRSMGMHV